MMLSTFFTGAGVPPPARSDADAVARAKNRRARLASPEALRSSIAAAVLLVTPIAIAGQIPVDSWPTYHGDYTGRRYSTLKQINTANVKSLSLAWVYRLNTSRA